eukprot:3127923-Amphidinium_carterae.1
MLQNIIEWNGQCNGVSGMLRLGGACRLLDEGWHQDLSLSEAHRPVALRLHDGEWCGSSSQAGTTIGDRIVCCPWSHSV